MIMRKQESCAKGLNKLGCLEICMSSTTNNMTNIHTYISTYLQKANS